MRIADWGAIEGEVLVAGGVLSNDQALSAFERAAEGRPVVLTGDAAGYCAAPAATLARIRALGWPMIAGNVERQLARDADGCGCGFAPGTACDRLSGPWYAHARAAMTPDLRDWMEHLPDLAIFTNQGRRVAVLHGGVTDISRFLWPSSDEAAFIEEIAALRAHLGGVDTVIAGHCGIAFTRDIGDVRWINPGSLGLPPHDGRPQTRFGRLSAGHVVIERLDYDHEAARSDMKKAGLTQGYDTTLTSGIWPSEDVLPRPMRRADPSQA